MSIIFSDEGDIGRISAISPDGMRLWIRLANHNVITVTSTSDPFRYACDDTVFVTHDDLEPAPPEVWPEEANASASPEGLWVGVVSLRNDDITVVNVGTGFRRVPTSDVEYEKGFTVEGTDSRGVTRILDRKPIRYVERDDVHDDDIAEFRHEPSETGTRFDDFGGLHEVVERARELIELPLARSRELATIGAKPIKGVLFTGLPGIGKTMLARIIADVAEATFYEISGPAVISKWVGESEQVLRRICRRGGPRPVDHLLRRD